jgi:hypothetical protein
VPQKHIRHHRGGASKVARKWFSLGGKILGGLVIGGPAIQAVSQNWSNPGAIPNAVLYGYTGIHGDTGQWEPAQTTVAAGSIIGGILIMKIFSYVAKRF